MSLACWAATLGGMRHCWQATMSGMKRCCTATMSGMTGCCQTTTGPLIGCWRPIKNWMKKHSVVQILLFIFFNVLLNGTDITTDFLTFLDLQPINTWWAGLTLSWMFVPFLAQIIIFTVENIKALKKGRTVEKHGHFKHIFIHFPFVLPLRNLYQARMLYKLGVDPKNSAAVEAIKREAAKASLHESYYEAGGQANRGVYL